METKVTLDRFEDTNAVLITKDKEEIICPKNIIPAEVKSGTVLSLSINESQKNTQKNQELAKEILNEILNV